jgi:hypothetical protein
MSGIFYHRAYIFRSPATPELLQLYPPCGLGWF